MTDRARRRQERSRRAVRAAVGVARDHGVRVDQPVVLADLFSLTVHLRPAPVVVRVATGMGRLRRPIGDWLRRELDLTAYLAAQGAPVVAPSTELPARPYTRDGFAMSFWTHLEVDPGRTPTAADCSAMLVDLHSVLRSYPGPLPTVGSTDIARGLELLDRTDGVVTAAQARLLHDAAHRLLPLAGPGHAVQPLHGDAHPGNVVATRHGLVWIDFEDACVGPVEWDLAGMMDADVVAAHHGPDPELLRRCTELRALQVVLCLVAFHDDFGDLDGWDAAITDLTATLDD